MKTYMPDKDSVPRKWYLVDIKGKTLGRVATTIAAVLRGKHKPTYTPSIDTGDFVVVVNSGKVSVTGKKLTDKMYHHHTGYPGGLRSVALGKLLQTKPEAAIEKAVQGMLPSGPLGRDMFKKLKVYAGEKHPHAAQNPEPLNVG
ncbi:MAG: 50S ribosomal protein L13 [Thermodesulfobacteriota bacterium]